MTSRCTKPKKQNLVISQKADVGRIIKHDYVRLHCTVKAIAQKRNQFYFDEDTLFEFRDVTFGISFLDYNG